MKRMNTSVFTVNRFEECGSGCVIEWSDQEQRFRCCASYCKSRHCEVCMRSKANKIAANLRHRLEEKPNGRYRFITLTLLHTNTPLADQIKHLYDSFRRLRNMKAWKRSQRGGTASLEIKWDPKTRQWHPHLHIIGEGDYLDKFQLSALWKDASNGSYIVDIRRLDSGKDAAHYVSKYITKGTNGEVWSDDSAAAEWLTATKGVRSCLTFGTWRGYKLTANTSTAEDWKPVSTYTAAVQAARRGERWAVDLLCNLTKPENREEVRGTYVMEEWEG